jgi:hypothetical protein
MDTTNIKSLPLKIFIVVIILVVIFFGLKGFLVTVWLSNASPTTYAVYGEDSRIMKIIFLEKNNTVIWYNDPNTEFNEIILTHMRGTYGTHYFWRFWHIDGPGISFGYRMYPDGVKPVVMEMEVIQKFIFGKRESTFPKIGEKTYSVILFQDSTLEFQEMYFKKEPTSTLFLQELLSKLGS